MRKIYIIALMMGLLCISGCKKITINKQRDFKPFPHVAVTFTIQYDRSEMNGSSNGVYDLTIDVQEDGPHRFELWRQTYRGKDMLVEEIQIESKEVIKRQYNSEYAIYPFYRIECYSSMNGELRHKTLLLSEASVL